MVVWPYVTERGCWWKSPPVQADTRRCRPKGLVRRADISRQPAPRAQREANTVLPGNWAHLELSLFLGYATQRISG